MPTTDVQHAWPDWAIDYACVFLESADAGDQVGNYFDLDDEAGTGGREQLIADVRDGSLYVHSWRDLWFGLAYECLDFHGTVDESLAAAFYLLGMQATYLTGQKRFH